MKTQGVRDDVYRLLKRGNSRRAMIFRFLQIGWYLSLHRKNYDLVYCVTAELDVLICVLFLRLVLGFPIAVEMTLMGVDDPVTLMQGKRKILKYISFPFINAWILISKSFFGKMKQAGIAPRNLYYIPQGIEIQRFVPPNEAEKIKIREKLGLSGYEKIIVSIGATTYRKGIDRVLHVWESLSSEKNRDCLVWVGPTSSERESAETKDYSYDEYIRGYVHQSDRLSSSVKFTGKIDNVEDYLRAADLFLFLSRYEGMPNAVMEAMACGLPCIVSPLDGTSSEIIENGHTGFIVCNPDNIHEVTAVVSKLWADTALRKTMGAAARHTVENRYTLEIRANAISQIVKRIIGNR
ncbi:MAG: glycosyltransferase family 4 protein [Candidatus Omnitrophica bacterium]|nr:glycosyltransferase family 4 protein [Candidatus Omnitrophota bacterium]